MQNFAMSQEMYNYRAFIHAGAQSQAVLACTASWQVRLHLHLDGLNALINGRLKIMQCD